MPTHEAKYLKKQGDLDLENDDYVVLEREILYALDQYHVMAREKLLTFNDIVIHRRKVLYARNASAQKKPKSSKKNLKEFRS